jgi:hypothetical protein
LPEDVLELALGAAHGSFANHRFPFLAVCKVLYESAKLWGSKIIVKSGHPFREGWLRERKSIASVQISDYEGMLAEKDLAFLKGSQVKKLDIKSQFGQRRPGRRSGRLTKSSQQTSRESSQQTSQQTRWQSRRQLKSNQKWLWEALAGLPLVKLAARNYRGSLRGAREALPQLQTLKCRGISDTDLVCLRGLKLLHLGVRCSVHLTTLAGIEEMPLVSLDVSHCPKLQNLDVLAHTTRLAELNVNGLMALRPETALVLTGKPLAKLTCSFDGGPALTAVLVSLGATLHHLNFDYSSICDADLFAIRGLHLITLDFWDCWCINATGVAHLAEMASTLEYLDLGYTGISHLDCPPQLRPLIKPRR